MLHRIKIGAINFVQDTLNTDDRQQLYNEAKRKHKMKQNKSKRKGPRLSSRTELWWIRYVWNEVPWDFRDAILVKKCNIAKLLIQTLLYVVDICSMSMFNILKPRNVYWIQKAKTVWCSRYILTCSRKYSLLIACIIEELQ